MGSYWLSKFAERDLAEILRYTIKTWGMEQGAVYFQLLATAKTRIVNNPILPGSKTRDDLANGCRVFRVAKHLIFYRVNGNSVEIARILHESMDFSRHVDEETFP
ncbi:MAG: type II toxin-antitoxin system RelE/ParE family toxin [Luteolibacter sp.]|uniref:type II toxin-antitoxin system RelE/ParE family toxin n=1 Tax=Luteolibacter sp. TaxID=1962973 RepID=UPI0032652963